MRYGIMVMAAIAVLMSGCQSMKWHPLIASAYERQSREALQYEQAALLAQYRECLKRSESNPEVRCEEYRRAIDVDVNIQ